MATQVPKPSAKRQRLAERANEREANALQERGMINPGTRSVLVQLRSGQDDSPLGATLSLPSSAGPLEMAQLVNTLRRQLQPRDEDEDDEDIPYTFHVVLGGDHGSAPTRVNICLLYTSDAADE